MAATINPYLDFDGNAEEAFNFYKSVFGGEFQSLQRMGERPEGANVPANEKHRIMHVALPLGKNNILMGCDVFPGKGHVRTPGNNFHLSVGTESRKEADRIFNALAAGGQVSMPLQTTFWGSYFGMLKDKFGVQWMVSFDESSLGKQA
jgi:PhnB protein